MFTIPEGYTVRPVDKCANCAVSTIQNQDIRGTVCGKCAMTATKVLYEIVPIKETQDVHTKDSITESKS